MQHDFPSNIYQTRIHLYSSQRISMTHKLNTVEYLCRLYSYPPPLRVIAARQHHHAVDAAIYFAAGVRRQYVGRKRITAGDGDDAAITTYADIQPQSKGGGFYNESCI